MKEYDVNKVKNIAFAGHNGSGKTSLAEAILYKAGASDRLGKTADGTTVCDFDPEEIKRQISIGTSLASFEYNGLKVLGSGTLTKKLTVQAKAFSKSAEAAITNAGGKIEVM